MTVDQRLIELWEASGAREKGVPIERFKTTEEIQGSSPRIGLCTTIKGPERFPLLLQSLCNNLRVFDAVWKREHYKPKVHFVILAYGEPELEAYISSHLDADPLLKEAVENGIVTLARTEAEHFEYADAKNTAARVAMEHLHCNVLCNVDSDNLIGAGGNKDEGTEDVPDFITFLNKTFARSCDSVVRPVYDEGPEIGMPIRRGIGGRIAISAYDFLRVRGYDEENFALWAGDDQDLMRRVLSLPISTGYGYPELVSITDPLIAGDVIEHPAEYRWQNLAPELRETSKSYEESSTTTWEKPEERGDAQARTLARLKEAELPGFYYPCGINPVSFANPNGWKRKTVEIARYDTASGRFNFKPHDLRPLHPVGEWERNQEEVYAPDKAEMRYLAEQLTFARLFQQALENFSDFDKEAIVYAAKKEQGLGGFEQIELVAYRVVNRAKNLPVELKRIRESYQGYLDDREKLIPKGIKTEKGTGFVDRYAAERNTAWQELA